MKPSERIARRYFLDVRGAEDTLALAELIEPLADLLADCGVDKAFNVAEFHSHSDVEYGDEPCHCVACQAIRKLEAVG